MLTLIPWKSGNLLAALLAAALCSSVASAQPAASQPSQPAAAPTLLESLQDEARALEPHVESQAVLQWLRATDRLTPITPRSIYFRPEPRAVLSQAEFAALPEADRATFTPRPIADESYYATNFGTPLCYARALDLAAAVGGWQTFADRRILDYGYGQIGQIRLLAACGADVVGVDPAAGLRARYSLPEDQGPYPPAPAGSDAALAGPQGSVKLVSGFWPGHADTAAAVGTGFDLIIARNVLKHGYVHPIAEVPATTQIDLSCSDEQFLKATLDSLNPGGLLIIYNLGGPRLREGAYDASSDINCPWTRAALESAGFEVVAFDMDDSEPTRQHALIFGWAQPTDPIAAQWFSLYTIVRKPAA